MTAGVAEGTPEGAAMADVQDFFQNWLPEKLKSHPSLASDIKAGIAEYMAQTGSWPVDLADAGLGSAAATDKTGRYVSSVGVGTGTITITYGKDVNDRINGDTLSIQPLVNANGDVVWVCGNAVDPTDAVADPGDGTDSIDGVTSLQDKHMPASCRSGFGGS